VKGVSGIWSFPKGRCMPNEEEEACAKREVYEETGLEIDNLKDKKKFKIGRNIYFKYDCVENQFTNFTVHDTNEVEEVSWKSIKELRQIVCNKDIRSLLNYQNRLYTYHSNVFN
jgi:8-oxo-dGTP pyrophosphatase MutT (NUDIX family)